MTELSELWLQGGINGSKAQRRKGSRVQWRKGLMVKWAIVKQVIFYTCVKYKLKSQQNGKFSKVKGMAIS
jgi:hypothetical protein